MISIRVDSIRQRIDMKVDQQVGEEALQKIIADLRQGVALMRPGWLMASDLRGLLVVNPALNKYVVEIQKVVLGASPRKNATLLDSHVLKLQLNVDGKAAGINETSRRFDNEQEWRKWQG